MRKFIEPTARNLLRKPLVLGVPFAGLLALSFLSLSVFVLGGGRPVANIGALVLGVLGYGVLRVFSRFAKPGWEESILFCLERLHKVSEPDGALMLTVSPNGTLSAPDTLTETDLLNLKDGWLDRLRELQPGARVTLAFKQDGMGASLSEVTTSGRFDLKRPVTDLSHSLVSASDAVYSLYCLPVVTDPLWLYGIINKLPDGARLVVSFCGVPALDSKRRIEHARRSNAPTGGRVSDIDSAVNFDEASLVLQGLSRGDDAVLEVSIVIVAPGEVALDDSLFCREKKPELALVSALGIRKRFHRSHLVRAVTACDLIPNICDPAEEGTPILRSPRGRPLYFWPQDPRLEALHWLVVGASGSGKSFFTGLVLKRMVELGTPMSVFFVDHHRSFRRLVVSMKSPYLEPSSLRDVEAGCAGLFDQWNHMGSVSGIELSDMNLAEKKAAIHCVLSRFETFLRCRETSHPVYLVLDECWNFMRDEPVLVQRAFREFRKLNGAVIAITQSLQDFLTDESGQSIFQNAPIRILLRQGEDVGQYQGILGLNPIETARVSRLRQQKGVFSECLIKTPYLSRLGRLYPSENEYALLRTDNLRAEIIAQSKKGEILCASLP